MFERYTEGARRVLFFARYEASQLGSASIGAEHLLLGLLRDGATGVAARTFRKAGLDYDQIRAEVTRAAEGNPKVAATVEMPLSRGCKAVLEWAAEEASGLKHPHVGVDHLLLGLLYAGASVAGGVLERAGLHLDEVRVAIQIGVDAEAGHGSHIVLVQVRIDPDMHDPFVAALLHNARESLRRDPGCLRFDVSQDKDDPTRWVLYEVYDSPDAHAAHRRSPHFLAYDAVATKAVVEKTVAKYAGRHVT